MKNLLRINILVAAITISLCYTNTVFAKGYPLKKRYTLNDVSKISVLSPDPLPIFENGKFLKGINWGLDINCAASDFMLGTLVGLQTTKWNFSFNIGYSLRPVAKKVYVESDPDDVWADYYIRKESRNLFYANLEKRFGINFNLSNVGALIGGKVMLTFGNHKYLDFNGITQKEAYATQFIATPTFGIYWMNNEAIIKLTSEFVPFDMLEKPEDTSLEWPTVSKHRIALTFIYCFNIKPTTGF